MKTIFLSMFEGVEAKNLLRTDVVRTLLSDPHVQVVLLMKSKERIALYRKEFDNPRLLYAVMPYDRSLGSGFDRFFGYLKFLLLNTKTTRLRRRIAREEGGSLLVYVWNSILSALLGHRFTRRIVRALDFLLVPPPPGVSEQFELFRPELVVLAHLFEEPEIHVLREAKRRGIRTLGIVNSWDKVTSRAIMRLLPDKALVFNEMVKEEMVLYNDMRPERVEVCGIPQYDHYFSPLTLSRAEFLRKLGVPEDHKLIVFAPFGRAFNNTTWEAVDLLEGLRRSGVWGDSVSLLVRFQPNDFIEEEEMRKRPAIRFDMPGMRFSTLRGVDWDMGDAELEHLKHTLAHLDVLICYASSIAIDALIFDKPVVNIGFELRSGEPAGKLPTRHYEFEHYQKVLRHGAFRMAKDGDELARFVGEYLRQPERDREARRTLLLEQLFALGGSGKRMGEYILRALP